jgi:hypothetical protein
MLKHRKAQGYLEFIIVLPGVLLLLLLAFEFAMFWYSRMAVSTATFEAARTVAVRRPVAAGYATYSTLVGNLGQLAGDPRQNFTLKEQPAQRSVSARADVPWPTGLGALMGGGLQLDLKSSAFFRLEEFYPGPPGTFE